MYCETRKVLKKTADVLLPAFLRKKAALAKSGETFTKPYNAGKD